MWVGGGGERGGGGVTTKGCGTSAGRALVSVKPISRNHLFGLSTGARVG